jgi:predicted nucleic acid-binding protein
MVFLDADILFSAALGGESFTLLWDLAQQGKIVLVSSLYCMIEARRNIERKRLQVLGNFEEKLSGVHSVISRITMSFQSDLNDKDRPVFDAAIAAGVDVLLTGDIRHFGLLMKRSDLPLRKNTLRTFLFHE